MLSAHAKCGPNFTAGTLESDFHVILNNWYNRQFFLKNSENFVWNESRFLEIIKALICRLFFRIKRNWKHEVNNKTNYSIYGHFLIIIQLISSNFYAQKVIDMLFLIYFHQKIKKNSEFKKKINSLLKFKASNIFDNWFHTYTMSVYRPRYSVDKFCNFITPLLQASYWLW